MREISLDTETTGLSFANGDKITEIGCVEIIDKKITGKSLHLYVNPEREVSEKAQEISGLTFDFLKKFKTFKEISNEFLNFVADSRLVIHNAPFDIGFLNYELGFSGSKLIDPKNVVDTLVLAKEKYPGSPSTLDALCRRFSVDASARIKHGALIDAELLAEVYLHMSVELFQKDIFGMSQNIDEETYVDEISFSSVEIRNFPATEDELCRHKAFLQKLKNPIWNRLENLEN